MRRRRGALVTGLATLLGLGSFGLATAPADAAKRTTTVRTTTTRPPSTWRVLQVSSKGLAEVSGCAVSRRDPNRVWVHNDSGGEPVVIPIDLRTGAVGQKVTLRGVDAVDFEDIAITSDGTLYVADIGDNNERRADVELYRFAEPTSGAVDAVDATRIELRYPDGAHNAEALVVAPDGSTALIFTKDTSGVASVFRADLSATAAQVMVRVGTVKIAGEGFIQTNLITAADLVGSDIVLRTYWNGYLLKAAAGGSFETALTSTPKRFDVPLMVQGEALCASPDGRTLVTASESRGAATFALAVGPAPR